MRFIDRVAKAGLRLGIGARSTALLETTGRKSGEPRVTPVTNGIEGDRFWIVTEHGTQSNYVRNLLADPHVRVKAGREWRSGVAAIVDDDPQTRLEVIAARNPRAKANTEIVRKTGSQHLVIRVDLEPRPPTRP